MSLADGLNNQGGITLLELLVTVAIVGILAIIAVPQMNYAIQNSRVRSAVSDTHTSLLLARSEAIKRSTNVQLEQNGSWGNGWTVSVPADSTQLAVQDALAGVTTECYITTNASTSCGATLGFDRNGRATSYIEFRFHNDANVNVPMRCVRVDLSGRAGALVDTNGNPADGCN